MSKLYKKLTLAKAKFLVRLSLPKLAKSFDEAHETGELRYLSDDNFMIWKKAFLKMLRKVYIVNTDRLPKFFVSSKIKKLSTGAKPVAPTDIISIIAMKDVPVRVKMFIEHGRNIGIDRFAIIDNGSPSELTDWLSEQDDVDLYHTSDPFQTIAKDSWINRTISQYGFDRWYFQLDSDELPVYYGMEEHSLHDVVNRLEKLGYTRARAIMIDMYSKEGVFRSCKTGDEIKEQFNYFDPPSSLFTVKHIGMDMVKGGPRYRMDGYPQMLSKCPLYKLRAGEIALDSHFTWPFDEVQRAPFVFPLLHYKCIAEDRAEYKERAAKGNFAGGSKGYKALNEALEKNKQELNFYFDKSIEYKGVESMKTFEYFKDIFAEQK